MARSNNNNKLKAFVRFDGSGRIVSSSLIVQAFKPKVGNWKEIDAKECCNYTTTTTSTTVAPTTTTTTTVAALVLSTNLIPDIFPPTACGMECPFPIGYYSVYMTQGCIDIFPTSGCAVWNDAAGIIPFPDGSYNDCVGGCIVISGGLIA
jgi:hypothetical protein